MMGATWWSSADAEFLTLAEEHAATGGDHFGIVQTACPICLELARLREERDPPVPPEDPRAELVEHTPWQTCEIFGPHVCPMSRPGRAAHV